VYCELPNSATASTKTKNNDSSANESAQSTSKSTTEKPAVKATTYIVKKGDTLHSIAQRFKVTVAQLRDWNHLKANDSINQGQKIIVALVEKKMATIS